MQGEGTVAMCERFITVRFTVGYCQCWCFLQLSMNIANCVMVGGGFRLQLGFGVRVRKSVRVNILY